MEEILGLVALERDLVSVHREAFPLAERGEIDQPSPVDEHAIRAWHRQEALRGVSLFARAARRQAEDAARISAEARIAAEQRERAAWIRDADETLDEEWRLLLANDPHTVLVALEEAFEDNRAPAVPVGCADGAAHIIMTYPPITMIPETKAASTPSAKPTIHKRSKTERNELYAQAMASNILAAVREGFAVAPALRRIVVVTVSHDTSVGGVPNVSALAATGFDRPVVERFNWDALDPWRTLEAASPRLLNVRGRTSEIAPLDLSSQPDIALVVQMVTEAFNRREDDPGDPNGWAVELSRPPSQKIPVIKALRKEFGYGLREAKGLVDSGGVVATGLSNDRADRVARTLGSLGAEARAVSRLKDQLNVARRGVRPRR